MATPFAKHCLLTRGQEVMVEVDDSRWRIITLPPAEMSLHHARLVHGSPPNPSGDRRIGFAIRYTPTDVAQLAGEDSATLARGEDRHRHFMSEPAEPRSRPGIRRASPLRHRGRRPDPLSRRRPRQLTTSPRRWRNAAEPARGPMGAEHRGCFYNRFVLFYQIIKCILDNHHFHRRAKRNVDPKSPCCLPQDWRSPPCSARPPLGA